MRILDIFHNVSRIKVYPYPMVTKHSSKGSALVASMAASAVVGAMLMTLMNGIQSAAKVQRGLSSVSDLDELRGLISLVIANKEVCDRTLLSKTFDPDPANLSKQVISGLIISDPGDNNNILAKPGMPLNPTMVLNDVFLSRFIANGPDRYIARLNIQAGPKIGLTGQTTTRGFYVAIRTQNKSSHLSEISSCISQTDPSEPITGFFLGSASVYRVPTDDSVVVNFPAGTKNIVVRTQSNFLTENNWLSEDTSTLDAVIELSKGISNGTLSHTGGNGSDQTIMAVWNAQILGAPVSLVGDLYANGYGLTPITRGPSFSVSGNQLTISQLPKGFQDAWLFQFLNQ